ncbi:DUF859 family phage minor structural protein [Streptococcus anginosus]|uniref:DUF859 family phage minor structural protein n=1 Tax=Streptococcus anginosus TaxID=1328 RepID=UPI001243F308|nr:DUF859 family phage minor structural protein [Streptococcus anginosus]KAA9324791.1 hypothetical protein F6H95_00430 [Streptococcus anginosus]
MARASFSGMYGHNLQLEITSGGSRQDIANNFSMVNVQVRLIANGYAALFGAGGKTLKVSAGGESKTISVDTNISQNQNKLIFDKEFKVPHDSNGSKSVYISARLDINQGGYDWAAVGVNVQLPTIPRASTGSTVNSTIGQPITLNISRHSDSFKHAIWVKFGNYDKKIAGDNVDTSFTWTPEMSMINELPNASSGYGTLTYITYNNGREIGRDTQPVTLSVPDNIKPTLTGFTLTDTNTAAASIVPGGQAFIQILSNIKVNFGQATGTCGSTITGYYAEIVGKNQSTTTQGGSLGIMNYTGNVAIRARVTDSRGRTSNTIEKTVSILEYFAPILSFGIARSGAQSSTLTITRNAKVAPLTVDGLQKNQMKLTFKVAQFGSDDYKVDTGSASGTWTTVSSLVNSNANLQGEYAANSSWTVLGILEDKFTSSEFAVNVATEQVVLSYDRYGIGVGKIRERGALDVKGNTYIDGFLRHCVEWAGDVSTNDLIEGGDAWTNKDTPNNDWGVLETFKIGNVSEKEATQRFTHRNGGKVWYRYRHYQAGNWTPWVVEGIDNFYPIGSIYQSTEPTNPATFMGGVWERFGNGRVLVGVDEADADFNSANKTSGSKEHRHDSGTYEAMIGSVGEDTGSLGFQAGNKNEERLKNSTATYRVRGTNIHSGRNFNHFTEVVGHSDDSSSLPPYVTIYRWCRTA